MLSEDDVFTDTTPDIVDCDLLEAAKENVKPLGTGRRVTALSAILATPHAQRDSKLAATRNRLRINVELALDDDEDGDPLEAYCRLVYWTIENYPQGPSVESGLLELLEEATRVLKDDRGGKWRGDLKYLKLWLLYASFVERPTLIYRFLIANEIGTDHALLYEEYAAVLERDGRRKDADDAYNLGIARRAQPLDHLKARRDDFQKRMMSNTLSSPAAATTAAATSTRAPTRTVLGSSSSSRSTSRSGTSSTSRGLPTSRSLPLASTSSSSSSSSRTTSNNAPLQIFVDPTGSESQAAAAEAEEASATINTWTDIGTRKTRIKENVPEVKKLVGTTLKGTGRSSSSSKRSVSGPGSSRSGSGTSGAGAGSSGSRITIFRDPPPEDIMPPPPPPTSVPAPAPAAKHSSMKLKSGRDAAKTSSKSTIVPFVDEEDNTTTVAAAVSTPAVSSTPKFTPFRDEDPTTTPEILQTLTAPESVMKLKPAINKTPGSTSEMEALRKDPLKNYPDRHIDVDHEGDG
ncbi:hypothetical protein H0H93_005285 [Arthromyces matolae]|nr:hypothetical protein H0H93_005285 [Arthromyces matolae]